jgi:hypothetical protein
MADLPSILGGMAQGFIDFGKGAVDLFGTGGAAIGDLVESARTGKVTTKNQDDFRKWLYNTDSVKDAAAKGLGTTLNGVQTALDYIPGVNTLTRNPLGNAAQGALGGLADEFKTYGENYDLGRAGQRAAVSAAGAAASGSLADALKGSSNALLSSNTLQGLARGATSGAISGGGYAAIDGGDVLQSALQGAGTGALIGGATGAFQDFKPAKTYGMALTDDERAARIANAQKQIDDIGPVSRFSNNPDDIAKRARISELQGNIRAYQNGYDTAQDYADAMAAKSANRANTQSATATQGQVYAPNMGEMEYGAPVQEGYTRLYRGITQEFDPQYNRNAMDNMNGYESWTDSYDLANRHGDGKYVYSIDVPTSRIANSLYDENPNSANYGDRNFIAAIEKAAGLDGIDGNEYLLNTNDELRSGLTYNRVNAPKALEATLADADMAVNNPKLTPEQEAYFKDSVIRDENGNLIPLYHGSNSKFTVFDSSKGGQSNKTAKVGHWFTPSEEGARNFANSVWYGDESEPTVYSTYLNVKNPKIYEAVDNSAQIKALNNEMDGLRRQLDGMRRGSDDFNATYKKYNDLAKQIDNLSYGDPYEQFRSDIYAMEGKTPYQANVGGLGMMMDDENAATQKYVQSLRDQGYDGIIIRGTNYDNGTLGGINDQYVVFDSNQIKDINNLKPTDAPSIMESRIAPEELDLARALSDQDLLVNNAKIAPGQLGLFDDMPTQTPKTGTRQTSLFDQPQEGVDYYGDDIEAPVTENGLISRDIEDLTQVPIDVNTLPKGWLKARELADMGKRAKQIVLDPNAPNRALNEYNMALYSDAQYGRNNPVADIIDRLGSRQLSNEIDRGAARLLSDQLDESGDDFAKNFVTGAAEVGGNIGHYKDAPKARLADQRVSELLNIGRSSSMLSDSLAKPTSKNALGDQWKGTINIKGNDLSSGGDDASSVLWHERMHAFQDAEKMGYDKRVVDAYNDLREDLAKLQHDNKQILRDHGKDAKYWGKPIEQEARMAQHYLDSNYGVNNLSKVYARDSNGKLIRVDDNGQELDPNNLLHYYTGKPVKRTEYAAEDKQIKAAFDKFIGKLQKLSRQGVALPALTALLGGGAYMASQENDKEKEVK